MKKIVSYLSIILVFTACGGEKEKGFVIKGDLENGAGKTVRLEYYGAQGKELIDSATLDENGEFKLTPKLPEHGFYYFSLSDQDFALLVLDTTEQVTLTGNADSLAQTYEVKGSGGSVALKEFNEYMEALNTSVDSLNQLAMTYNMEKDNTQVEKLRAEFQALMEKKTGYAKSVIEEDPGSLVALVAVNHLDQNVMTAEDRMKYYETVEEALSAKHPNVPHVQQFSDNLKRAKQKENISTGKRAPDFTLETPEGEKLSLSDLKGKVVLLDFWASWCRPCRMENPHVVEVYKKYKDKGFTVMSVSLDGVPKQPNPKANWVQAIQDDNLIWENHVSDLAGWSSPVAQLYGVESIPQTFLIDQEGNIIATGLRSAQLEEKLKEILG